MDHNERTLAILDLLADRVTVAEVAARFGATEADVTAWKAMYLEGARSTVHRPRARRMPRMPVYLVVPLAMALVGGGYVGHVRSQAGCAQTLPAPLTTFCPGQPAVAAQMNGNFQQLVNWLQAKVGNVGTNGVQASSVQASTVDATSVSASTVTGAALSGAYVPASYQSWSSSGTGAGGAAIYNDSGSFKRLMVVGNNSGGGSRRIGLWDDVSVAGNFSAGANSWDGASYTGGNSSSLGSEPTTDGWARGRQACNNVQAYTCPNGQYVCGIEFWHGCGWSWYDEATRVRCCSL